MSLTKAQRVVIDRFLEAVRVDVLQVLHQEISVHEAKEAIFKRADVLTEAMDMWEEKGLKK